MIIIHLTYKIYNSMYLLSNLYACYEDKLPILAQREKQKDLLLLSNFAVFENVF